MYVTIWAGLIWLWIRQIPGCCGGSYECFGSVTGTGVLSTWPAVSFKGKTLFFGINPIFCVCILDL